MGGRAKLTGEHVAIMRFLADRPLDGALTVTITDKVHRLIHGARWSRRRLQTLGKRGLVRRHEQNDERWFLTDAGREALRDGG